MQQTTIRFDDAEVGAELACQRERANWLATRYGLPAIGSKMVNQHGLEWEVHEHVAIPTYDSLHRWREGEVVPAQDLYPVIVPANLSPKLTEFFMAIDRCTTKTFAIVDTMPGLRRDGNVPGVNHIDTICHPTANILFLDAAQVNETIIAHELGHAWVQYVDECEDLRVMEDAGDPQRMRLVGFVQSFVLDLKVNELIRQKGFDMAPIEEDQRASVVQLAQFVGNGGRSDLLREEVIWATTIAERLLQSNDVPTSALIQFDNALKVIQDCVAPVVTLAERMADAVRQHGYGTHAEITASIDECLHAAFEHCGDSIELDRELIAVPSQEPNLDKWPDWIEGAPLAMKTAIGKIMAKEGIPSSARWSLSDQGHQSLLSFILEDGEHTESWLLEPPFPFRDPLESVRWAMENQRRHTERFEKHLAEVDRINRQNHERNEQMLRQAGVSLPSMPQMPSLVVQTPRTTHAHISAARTDGFGLPLGKQLPHLPSSRSGQTPSGLFGGVLLSLPQGPRHYMAGLARFLTAARLREQIEGEHPYGYALNNPVTITDPTGLKPRYCRIDSDCPPDIQGSIKDFCRRIRLPLGPDVRPTINACIQKTASKFGATCNGITPERMNCMRRFCRGEGAVKCEICTGPHADDCAYNPGFTEPGGNWSYPHYPIVILCMNNINHPGCVNFDGSPSGIFNFIHELGHACGISHNVPPGNTDRQCNDILACCMYQVLILGRDGSTCWKKVRK